MSHMETIGWQQDNVYTADEIVRRIASGDTNFGKKAFIWDGRVDITAIGIAEMLADQGCEVEMICPQPMIGGLDQIKDQTSMHTIPRLLNKGVVLSASTFIVMIAGKTVTVLNTVTMATREIEADTAVFITGKIPNDELYNELEGKVPELYKVGEARNPHDMGSANRDGHFVGRLL